MKNRTICKRCHRLRVVNEARYCSRQDSYPGTYYVKQRGVS